MGGGGRDWWGLSWGRGGGAKLGVWGLRWGCGGYVGGVGATLGVWGLSWGGGAKKLYHIMLFDVYHTFHIYGN